MKQATSRRSKPQKNRYFGTPIAIRTHRHGTIKLRWLSVGDMEFLTEQLTLEQSPRQFTAQIIHHQLVSPELDFETVQAWQDRSLARVAQVWARHKDTLDKLLPENAEPFEGFRIALRAYIDEQHQRLRETMSRFIDTSFIKAALPDMRDFQQAMGAQVLQIAEESRNALARMVEEVRTAQFFAIDTKDIAQGWLSQPSLHEALQPAVRLDEAVSRHFAEVAGISKIAEQTLARIPWGDISLAARVPFDIGVDLRANFVDFSQSYNVLSESLRDSAQQFLAYEPRITRLPAIEFLNEATLFGSVIVENPKRINEIRPEYRVELQTETEDALYIQLRALDANLIPLWEGTRHSIESDNPDKVRHATISMRELLTHVLHRLAPDESVRQWSNDPAFYVESRPTRKARLLYICRQVNNGPFSEFVSKDVGATIAFIDLFQRGTHQLVIPYTEAQVKALRVRMEGVLRFLLEIASNTRNL